MRDAIKLGIFNCDRLDPAVEQEFGSYPQMFMRFFARSAIPFEFTVYQAIEGEYPAQIDDNDAYLITGSKFDAYGKEPWIARLLDYIRSLAEQKKPLIGICFGHQLIAQALGGQVEKSDKGWGVGIRQVELYQQRDWMEPALANMNLLYSHQDQVVTLPPDALAFAGDSFCPNAGMLIGDSIVTLQGHPEFEREYMRYLLAKRGERIGERTSRAAIESLSATTDQDIVGQWLSAFIYQSL